MKLPLLAAMLFVLLFVCVVIAAAAMRAPAAMRDALVGGATEPRREPRRGHDHAKSAHIVVDTLNLTHWLHANAPLSLTPALIAETIDRTAPALRRRHPGRVMYVLKDRESQFNDEAARAVYQRAADRNSVYVSIAERYPDPPKGVAASAEHSARGRDDYYVALLAHRWRCAVLTEDRLHDFAQLRETVQPFHVYEFAFWRALPQREFVRPDAEKYTRLKKPRMVRYSEYFSGLPR